MVPIAVKGVKWVTTSLKVGLGLEKVREVAVSTAKEAWGAKRFFS